MPDAVPPQDASASSELFVNPANPASGPQPSGRVASATGAASPDPAQALHDQLAHDFSDPELFKAALTHASHADQRVDSNERMEFLGDAILGMVVCEHLYHEYPDLLEGEMTKIKSCVVSRRTCAIVAEELQLTDAMRLGKGMAGRSKLPSSIAAAAVESLVAALYLDAGLDAAREFIVTHFDPHIQAAAESTHQSNYKSALQQFAQQYLAELLEHPAYVLVDEKGPDHAKAFAVAVEIAGHRFPLQWANAKKEAEQRAARAALEAIGMAVSDPDQPDEPPALLNGQAAQHIAHQFLESLHKQV
ncbi:MAG: ribonuclease III [Planctomycetota bacterium]